MTNKPKSDDALILADNLDLVRTLARLKSRKAVRKELNELEPAVLEAHEKQVKAGKVVGYDIDLTGIFGKALPPGDEAA